MSGGKEAILDVRRPGQPSDQDPERILVGHSGNICALDVCPSGTHYVVSGSWDASARLWDVEKGEEMALLEGHEAAVWAVLAFDRNMVITGELFGTTFLMTDQ